MKQASKFYTDVFDDTVEISLREKRGLLGKEIIIPVSDWQKELQDSHFAILAIIDDLIDNYNGSRLDNKITLPHESVVNLTEAQATMLGLPPSIPFAFDIRANGMIDQSEFSLSTSWVTSGGLREFIIRKGAFAFKGRDKYRIPSPVFEIVKAAEILSTTANDNAARYEALAALNEVLPKDEHGNKVHLDGFLGSIRVLHASSFSLQIPTGGEGFQFNPVLFSRKATARAQDDSRVLDEAENLLTPALQSTFADKRFKNWSEVRECYTVDSGVYVYIDPDLKNALGVVRQMQGASLEERREFIRSPQKIIKEKLGNDITNDAVEKLFVETEQYAQNVVGLGIWQPPVIPWLVKEPNSWLPEKFGIKIGDVYVQIRPEDVVSIRDEISEKRKMTLPMGMSEGKQETITYDPPGGSGPVEIPVNAATEEIFKSLVGYAAAAQKEKERQQDDNIPQDNDLEKKAEIFFLLVEDNIENIQYRIAPVRRAISENYEEPVSLKSSLKIHQKEGLKWLIQSWTQGAPGVLLADDMGLGKTLQALAFIAWIKERKSEGHSRCREPVLIIAPTGLLGNWQREIKVHLREPYLGSICQAYGNNLSAVRFDKKNDLVTGQVNLSRERLREYEVILTTYETYRDYHHSFAGIKFSTVIMDECQKIKNPKSQVNRALASMNAEFVVTMTGTPIENAMEDLWTILDRTWPGYLGDLKSFSSNYTPNNKENLSDLTKRLKRKATPEISVPILWRRMKEDILNDLPKKNIHPPAPYNDNWWMQSDMVVTMPAEQADAYQQVIARAKQQEPPPMLHTLHALRGISLHPINPSDVLKETNIENYDNYIKGSARLSKAIEILDKVRSKNEKALIFIETLDMQTLVANILKKRYGLIRRPSIINGKTGVEKIQKLVDEYQNDPNFDVMILSPKVGGVGLTLTAANHVIHLSRWWNPAVEDQSTDRIYRIGQKKDVHVYYPIAVHPDTLIREHSFDLKLHALLERKRQLSREMLIPTEDPEDTENLFKDTVGFSNEAPTITIDELDRMEPEEFENWAIMAAGKRGYIADRTPKSHDHGADAIIQHKETGQKFILQCKHSKNSISQDKVVEDLLRAREAYDFNAGLIALSNSNFSASVIRKMNRINIRFFDRKNIINWPRI